MQQVDWLVVSRAGLVWAGARLGKGRAALGPEGGSPVSTRAQCLKRSSISGTTPRQPRQPLCGCSFYSSSLQSHGYLAHFMIGDTYSRSHCRTGIETQVCQPHSLRQSPFTSSYFLSLYSPGKEYMTSGGREYNSWPKWNQSPPLRITVVAKTIAPFLSKTSYS